MEKYSLEVLNWGTWELEKDFSSLDRAKRYGHERFAQNEWRVHDRVAGYIVYSYDPAAALETVAREEVHRFAENERWRQIFAERAAAAVQARQQRERMAEVAARQRQQARDQARRERLRGFRFVGEGPAVLNTGFLTNPEIDHQQMMNDLFGQDYGHGGPKRRSMEDRVNWLKEGF